jgi:hypothetical protein
MVSKVVKIAGIVFLVLGFFLIIYSISFTVFKDELTYKTEYLKLNGGAGDSDKFYKLREIYLTPKYKLEDYGITFIILGSVILIVSFIGLGKIKTPCRKFWVIITGVIAALLTVVAYVCDLFLEMSRDGFPMWADSLGIPLMGVPFLLFLSLTWVLLNSIGMRNDFKTNVLIFPVNVKKQNIWYLIILFITIAFTLVIIIDGYFWQVLPGFLWIYFYSSIMIGIKEAKLNL